MNDIDYHDFHVNILRHKAKLRGYTNIPTGVQDLYPENLELISKIYHIINIQYMKSTPDTKSIFKNKFFFWDFKGGHVLEAFQLLFFIKVFQRGLTVMYIKLIDQKYYCFFINDTILDKLVPLLNVHPEQCYDNGDPFCKDDLLETFKNFKIKYKEPGQRHDNGSFDPYIIPKWDNWDRIEFDSFLLDFATFGRVTLYT